MKSGMADIPIISSLEIEPLTLLIAYAAPLLVVSLRDLGLCAVDGVLVLCSALFTAQPSVSAVEFKLCIGLRRGHCVTVAE